MAGKPAEAKKAVLHSLEAFMSQTEEEKQALASEIAELKLQKEALASEVERLKRELTEEKKERRRSLGEKSVLELHLASEQAAAATAVELHQRTRAVVRVKQEKVEELNDAAKCKVCFEGAANVLCNPCSHVVTCEVCFAALPSVGAGRGRRKPCPLCREPIVSHKKVFF